MNVEADVVRDIIWEKDKEWTDYAEARSIAQRLASKYFFPKDDSNILYYIREPIIQTEEETKKTYKGFARKIKIQSIMGSSILIMDGGMREREVPFGSLFTLQPADKPLNSIHLTF